MHRGAADACARTAGAGTLRQRKARTTVPDPATDRDPDLVGRNFRAAAPGLLLVADFTYVRWSPAT
ncbi:MAG TPA: hypothetical protein VFQ44_06585 [Streptosporangiaceae bacterium]|nr:hypothetical protein [Streptosporangiaceae bacterium]